MSLKEKFKDLNRRASIAIEGSTYRQRAMEEVIFCINSKLDVLADYLDEKDAKPKQTPPVYQLVKKEGFDRLRAPDGYFFTIEANNKDGIQICCKEVMLVPTGEEG